MTVTSVPRSVSDATRFTPTTPHASSKTVAEGRFAVPTTRKAPAAASAPGGGGKGPVETPEQRVARLRRAHQAAKLSQVSKVDKIIDGGRRFFDSAHKLTVAGLIGFTVVAGLVTVYTAADMIMYNKQRKAEFIEAQKKIEADSLEAARLAYITGKATDEQIDLVESVLARDRARAAAEGQAETPGSIFSKLPPLLSKPTPAGASSSSSSSSSTPESDLSVSEKIAKVAAWPSQSEASSSTQTQFTQSTSTTTTTTQPEGKKSNDGLWSWMTSSLKKEEEGHDVGTSQRRLGWDSLSEEDEGAGVRDGDLVRSVEAKQAWIQKKAHEAFEKEKENERKGGPLDQVGLAEAANGQAKQPAAAEKKKEDGWFSS